MHSGRLCHDIGCMQLILDSSKIYCYGVSCNSSCKGSDSDLILLDKLNHGKQHPHGCRCGWYKVLHDGSKFLSELNSHLLKALTRFIKVGLYSRVLYIKFLRDRGSLLIGFLGFLLLPNEHVDVTRKCRNYSRGTRTVLSHVLKHGGKNVHSSQFMQAAKQHQ